MPTARPHARSGAQADDHAGDGAGFTRRLGDSAQQVWLAGLGALGRAQSEGTRLFESLVKEGASYESRGRRRAEAGAEAVREEVETRFDQAREIASGGWERIERALDERVKGVLRTLQIPDRDEVEALRAQVEALKAQVRTQAAASRRRARPRPVAPAPSPADGA